MRTMAAGTVLGLLLTAGVSAQEGFRSAEDAEAVQEGASVQEGDAQDTVLAPRGTRVPLALVNSISTKNARPGQRIYLVSVYPVVVGDRVLIPPGTYVSGSVTSSKRPGRVKGKGELYLRFEQMILPNGVIRSLVGSVDSLDGRSPEGFDPDEGKISSESNKGADAATVGQTTAAGASIGVIAGAAGGRTGLGVGIGSAAGAAAGLASVLLSRGPDAVLEKGTQVDMVLDRDLAFTQDEVRFDNPLGATHSLPETGPGPDPNRNRQNSGYGGYGRSRFPL